jgi:hypothetical protein
MMSLAGGHAEPRPGLATRLSQQADRDAGPVEAVVTRPRERVDGDDYLRRIGPHAPDGEH